MDDKIKVQEEFENLIDELEKLKSINDLTSTNTENADRVISEVKTFVNETGKFKEKIEKDLKQRATANEELIDNLDNAIEEFVKASEEMSQSIDESVASITSELQNTFSDRFIKLEKSIKRLNKHLHSISTKIVDPEQLAEYQERIEEVEENIRTNNKKFATSLAEMITKKSNSVDARFEEQEEKINSIKKLLWIILLFVSVGLGLTVYLSFL